MNITFYTCAIAELNFSVKMDCVVLRRSDWTDFVVVLEFLELL